MQRPTQTGNNRERTGGSPSLHPTDQCLPDPEFRADNSNQPPRKKGPFTDTHTIAEPEPHAQPNTHRQPQPQSSQPQYLLYQPIHSHPATTLQTSSHTNYPTAGPDSQQPAAAPEEGP